MRKKILIVFILCAMFLPLFNATNAKAAKTLFDSKLQLDTYLSFGADILDVEFGYFDDDDDPDFAVLYQNSFAIFEDEGDGYEQILIFKNEDANFTQIESGDLIDRKNGLDDLGEVIEVSNNSELILYNPYPHMPSYLDAVDGNYYNMTFPKNVAANLSISIELNYGININNFTLHFSIKDNKTIGSLMDSAIWAYHDTNSTWIEWKEIEAMGTNFGDLNFLSSELKGDIANYIQKTDDNRFQIKINLVFNDTQDLSVQIEQVDLTDILIDSRNDIVITTDKGDLYTFHSIDSKENEYVQGDIITFNDYEFLSVPEEEKKITDLYIGDVNNNGKDDIIFSTFGDYAYDVRAEPNGVVDFTRHARITATNDQINTIACYDPASNSTNFILTLGTESGGYYRSTYNYLLGTYTTSLIANVSTETRNVPIRDIEILKASTPEESYTYLACLDRSVRVYKLLSGSEEFDEKLVESGNSIIGLTTGDFSDSGDPYLAVGTTLNEDRVMVLQPKSNEFKTYWMSSTYMREKLVSVSCITDSGEDTLVVVAKRHISILTIDFKDSDKDGLSDTGERIFYRTLPDQADSDEDGLNDGDEIFFYGTDPLDPDTDGDLIPDGLEIQLGTDPLDPLSSIIVYIVIPAMIVLAALSILILVRKGQKEKKREYQEVRDTPNLIPQVRRLIVQRLENFANETKGFTSKSELARFRKNLSMELIVIVLDRLYNFLEYLRLKGIIFTDRQERLLREIVNQEIKPIEEDLDKTLKALLMYETKFKQFQEEFLKVIAKYADWKKPATKAKGKIIVEELIKCPKCNSLQPKGSAFCLECGTKMV